MKALSNLFALIACLSLIWIAAEPKNLDAMWVLGEFIGLALLIISGRLAVYFDVKSKK